MATYNLSSVIKVDASARPTAAAVISSTTWEPADNSIRWSLSSLISVPASQVAGDSEPGNGGPTRPASGLVYPIIL